MILTAKRNLLQGIVLLLIIIILGLLFLNAKNNLSQQGIQSGFHFLGLESGFEVSESVIDFTPRDTYFTALLVGILGTLKVSLVGVLFALIIGVFVGLMRLSENWLLAKLSLSFIEIIRNIPLLLQLFFWYALFTEFLPSVRNSLRPFSNVFLNNRGLFLPAVELGARWDLMFLSLALSLVVLFFYRKKWQKIKNDLGVDWRFKKYILCLPLVMFLLPWVFSGAKFDFILPKHIGFNIVDGISASPEFIGLLLGLSLYTGAFMAEIIRSGILSVHKGQWEAAKSLGLSRTQVLFKVVIPQSLRVIIPAMTSQILNLIKNSSLAVAIAYPDFVSVANTILNQTGQAIEVIGIIMAVYLIFSLSTSFFMNWYNRKVLWGQVK